MDIAELVPQQVETSTKLIVHDGHISTITRIRVLWLQSGHFIQSSEKFLLSLPILRDPQSFIFSRKFKKHHHQTKQD